MTPPNVSFEFFPPRSVAASFRLWDAIQALAPLAPRFVSVTYGAGGSTRALTHEVVTAIGSETGLDVAAHLTCVGATRDETLAVARDYARAGVKRIVALRGDPAEGETSFAPHPGGFAGAVDLVAGLKVAGDFDIAVAAYPEPHPESRGLVADLAHLKAKQDAGATEAITQFFFDTEAYLRFRDAATAAGITMPIVPGILPVESWSGTKRFAARCGATIPKDIADAFETSVRDDREDLLAIAVATEICADLMEEGVEDIHFYTLNRPTLTREICQAIGVAPCTPMARVA